MVRDDLKKVIKIEKRRKKKARRKKMKMRTSHKTEVLNIIAFKCGNYVHISRDYKSTKSNKGKRNIFKRFEHLEKDYWFRDK